MSGIWRAWPSRALLSGLQAHRYEEAAAAPGLAAPSSSFVFPSAAAEGPQRDAAPPSAFPVASGRGRSGRRSKPRPLAPRRPLDVAAEGGERPSEIKTVFGER